ncbi:MAG: arsenite methyltransferase [Solirubrobacterales bacterium]|nr:arsenite methyltransferase [Solirubrobacterales bacterium]
MAEPETEQIGSEGCCSPGAQQACCAPEAKSECCGEAHGSSCGCDAGRSGEAEVRDEADVREMVRERYAGAATAASEGTPACCGDVALIADDQREAFGSGLYGSEDRDALPSAAQLASLGCGNPTAVADLEEGETMLDLGSGGGIDVLLSARRVGPTGKAYGLDMTDEMLELARRNQREAGVENVEFLKGTIEDVPVADDSVDVVISNCVINLSTDKPRVLREAARVLRPGGRFAVSDVVADPGMDAATRRDMQRWTGCIAGALTREDFERELMAAGFESVEILETHRVHEHAASAIVRARLAPDRVPAPREASGDHSGPPIACSLSSGEKGERLDAWRAVAAAALLESSVEERGLSLRLRHDAEAELRRLIAAESSCCPFLDFDLRSDGPDLRLTVAGPGGARPIILTLFGLERLENAEHAWSNG